MPIYLYVKTHNKTGLKYLGKTESSDPHKYPGSGTYWRNHLKKHGMDYRTEIIKECESNDEFTKWGLYYSNLWNIVESNEWANLKEETGDARGKLSEESRKKIGLAGKGRVPWNKGITGYTVIKDYVHSVETKQKISQSLIGRIPAHTTPHNAESIRKIKAARASQIITEETKQKISNSTVGRSKPLLTCPHCGKIGGAPQMRQWHFDRCKLQ